MPTSVRLDSETTRVLEQLARTMKVSKSDVLRQAIELLAGQSWERPYGHVESLIGSVRGGPPDLSERTGEQLRQLLMDRKR